MTTSYGLMIGSGWEGLSESAAPTIARTQSST